MSSSFDPSQIPQKTMNQFQETLQSGMMKIANIHKQRALSCYKANSDNMNGFVLCFRSFSDKAQDQAPIMEQRTNWCLFKYQECIAQGKSALTLRQFGKQMW
jgi:hypothetical protein